MGVWENLGDAETHARLLAHPYHQSVAATVSELVSEARSIEDREDLRAPQEKLVQRLVEAERRFSAESRLAKRRQGDAIDLHFWRRACTQLRAVGDALAWKFLAYDRPRIVMLSLNQRPGLLFGKSGSQAEWQACNEHWEAGRPALLAGITNVITASDLLIADGDILMVNEVKKGKLRMSAAQKARMKALDTAMRSSRVETSSGTTHILKSDVPLASYWSNATSAIDEAIANTVSTWVPTQGVALMFVAPFSTPKGISIEEGEARFVAAQKQAGERMGPMTHRILVHSHSFPYRPNRAVPFPLLPIPDRYAAMILNGEIVFTIELAVDRLVIELEQRGMSVQIVLDESDGNLRSATPVLRWTKGDRRGTIHAGVVEQIGVELNDLQRWAEALDTAEPPRTDSPTGMYLCLANEEAVWA